MPLVPLILVIAAFVCFVLAAIQISNTRVNLTPLGFACATLAWILIAWKL
jgi:hypothetical protein